MAKKSNDVEMIYNAAVKKKPGAERSAYLNAVCGDDNVLRARVETLLKAHEQVGDYLEAPAVDPSVTLDNSPLIEGPGMMIGRYKLLELIGEGGMGLVYLAEQQEPVRRQVALKIIKPGMDSKHIIARFEAERQALALLDHPNIARVLDAGTTKTARLYFVMEYVKGMSITEHCDRHKLTIEQRLKLFLQVCYGVQHAHQKGIIHRDIKPSNILVSVQDDRGLPKIIDFGIAKAVAQPLTEQTLFTRQGQMLGTPEYMSPEHADMANQDIDTRADIYSLGVVLYELLAGALPFEHEVLKEAGFAELQRILREEEPPRPSLRFTALGEEAKKIAERRHTQVVALARRLHRELEWIPLKAMRKDRSRRYRSASEVADDIQNYLNGAPLIAGPETAMYRVKKFVRKHAGSVATVLLVAVAIILGFVISTTMYFRAERAERIAQAQRKLAEERAEDYRRSLYFNRIALADTKYYEGNIARLRELLDACPNDLRGWEWYRLNYVSDQADMTLRDTSGVAGVVVSPDGRRFVSRTGKKDIKIWDAETGAELMTLQGHEARIGGVAFSPDGKRIVSGSRDKTIKLWDVTTGTELMTFRGHIPVHSVTCSPDGKRIASAGWDKTVRVLDVTTGAQLTTLHGHEDWVVSIAYSPNGKHIASGGNDGTIKLWDAATGAELMSVRGHESAVRQVAFCPDGERIVTGSMDQTIKVWSLLTGDELKTLRGHKGGVNSVVFSANGSQIVSGSHDGTIKVWEINSYRERTVLAEPRARVVSLAFTPDGERLISGSNDNSIKVWDVATGSEVTSVCPPDLLAKHPFAWHRRVVFSRDGKRFAWCSRDQKVILGKMDDSTKPVVLRGRHYVSVASSPDGRRVASGTSDGIITLWDATTGKEVMTFSGHKNWVMSVAFSPDGRRIASGSGDSTVKIWDAATGKEVVTLSGHKNWVISVAFSPDGKYIVSGSSDRKIKLWDASTGAELMTLHGHKGRIGNVSYSPDGKRIVSDSRWEDSVKVWDASTGTELMTLHGYGFPIAFSPDGMTLVACSDKGIVLLESEMPADGYKSRRIGATARKVVDKLYNEHGFYHEVIGKLATDDTLAGPVRQIALQIADSRRWEDAEKLTKESWEVVSKSNGNFETYRQALEKAEKANSLEPDNWSILNTLGIAQYHGEKYEDALTTLKRVEKMRTEIYQEPNPTNVAFLAMTLQKLDRAKDAQAALDRLWDLCKDKRFAGDKKAQAFLFKAEKLFAGKNTKLYSVWEHIEAEKLEQAAQLLQELYVSKDIEITEHMEGAVKRLGRIYYDRAKNHVPEYTKTITGYERAMGIDPGNAGVLNDLAWLRINCPPGQVRETTKALEEAKRACELTEWKNCHYISTFAAACSEVGDSNSAVKWQQKAIDLLPEGERSEWQAIYEERLKVHQSGKPYHQGDLWSFSTGKMVAWWKFDDSEGNTVPDLSGNGLHGRLVGDAHIVTDAERGRVLSLDGNGDYVDCGDSVAFDVTGSITVAAWIEVGTFDKDKPTVVDKDTWSLRMAIHLSRNGMVFWCYPLGLTMEANHNKWRKWGSAGGSVDVNDGKWHHVAGVYDGTMIRFYVDGTLDQSVATWGNIGTSQSQVRIGGNSEHPERGWNGLIDDVRIYSYALSEDEIKALYAGQGPGPGEKGEEESQQ